MRNLYHMEQHYINLMKSGTVERWINSAVCIVLFCRSKKFAYITAPDSIRRHSHCYTLVIRHGIWINNRIYLMNITCNC